MFGPKQKRISIDAIQRQATISASCGVRLGICLLALCFLILLASPQLRAQVPSSRAELRGTVLDAKTKEPIPNVAVKAIEASRQAVTDKNGAFSIPGLDPGTYSVEFSAAGYQTLVRKGIQLQGGRPTALDVELEEATPRLSEQVTVTGTPVPAAGPAVASVRKVDQLEISNTPASFRDLSRVLSATPGASQVTEKGNDLIVRGGSPWETGFYVDNIPIPNVNHFQNQAGVGGAIGVLDVDLIKDVDFNTGGFSAAYGDRMSSVVDIRFREGARDRLRGRLNLHLVGFGGGAEGPLLGDKGSFVLSARRCYYDVFKKVIGYGVAPNFGDIHFKFAYDFDPRNKLTILNIFGTSMLSYDLETAVAEGFNGSLDYKTWQNTMGMNWLRTWDNGYSNTSLSYSVFKNSATVVAVNPDASSSKYSATEEWKGEVVLRSVNFAQLDQRSRLEFGLELKGERFNFDNYISEYVNRWEMEMPALDAQGTSTAWKQALFATWVFTPAGPLALSLGVRTDYFSPSRAWHIAPRISASLQVTDRLKLHTAWGIYNQGLPLFLTAENPENRKKRDPYARHIIVGLRYDLTDDTQLAIEAYDKKYGNAPLTPDDPSMYILDSGVDFGFYRSYSLLYDDGIARAQGVEILIQKRAAERLYGILCGSFGRARYRDYAGVWRYRIIDNQYLISAVGGYRASEKWSFSGRWKFAGGRPYTPLDVERSTIYNRSILDKTKVLAKRYPPFMSISLQANRQFRFQRSVLNVYISVMNLLNKKNVDKYIWDRIVNRPGTIYQGPIVPEFGVEYVF